MGQRLNIEIHKNGVCLANAYYHWSGFSDSAARLTKQIIDNIDNVECTNDKELAIVLLLTTEAGIDRSEVETVKKFVKNYEDSLIAVDRNDGIIAVTEKGMEETRYWEEARVTIDLDHQEINFNALFSINEDEYEEYDLSEETIKELPEPVNDVSCIPFKDFDVFMETLNDISQYYEGYFKDENSVYGLIE